MRLLLPLVLLFAAISAQAEMGFYKKDDPRFPEAVRKASASVFQVVVPASDTYEVYFRENYKAQKFIKMHQEWVDSEKVLQYGQLNFCVENDLPVCLVYSDITISTAFVVFDSHHVATNRHADEQYLINMHRELKKLGYTDQEALDTFKRYPVPMKIAKDFKAINTLGKKRVEFARWFNTAPSFIDGVAGIGYLSTDLMVVAVEEAVGEPLPIASAPLQVGETMYIVGYPGMTNNRKVDHGVPDSNGLLEQSISSGKVISLDDGFSRIMQLGSKVRDTYSVIQSDSSMRDQWNKMIFTDADSYEGGSGSPYLNEKGEVAGIHSTGLIEYRGVKPGLTVSLGIAWPFQTLPEKDFELLGF